MSTCRPFRKIDPMFLKVLPATQRYFLFVTVQKGWDIELRMPMLVQAMLITPRI